MKTNHGLIPACAHTHSAHLGYPYSTIAWLAIMAIVKDYDEQVAYLNTLGNFQFLIDTTP